MTEFDVGLLVAAWLTGLAGGSGHCIGMCGGIVAALGVGPKPGLAAFARLGAAHLGRICSYSAAGAIAALAGASVFAGLFGPAGTAILRLIAACLIALIGLQLVFAWRLLGGLQQAGARFWRLLAPRMRALLPAANPLRAFGVGALWGWLPCGLVYAELAVAAASGRPGTGAMLMASFGLGTMLSLSLVSVLLHSLGLSRMPRQLSGVLLLLFAAWTLVAVLPISSH